MGQKTRHRHLLRYFSRCLVIREYLLEKYGKIGDVFIPKDKFTRESRGFAFVRFYDKRDAEDAMDALDGRMYDGRDLRIQMAKYGRPDINRFDSGRRGGRSRG